MIFGWRISAFGKPSAFTAAERPRPNTPLTKFDLDWPYRQMRELRPNEENLSLKALAEMYPFKEEKDS